MNTKSTYNLLDEPWLAVRRRSGQEMFIAPHDITSSITTDPVVAIATPRADLDAAALQFLIALLQTTIAADSKKRWRARLFEPPSSETLREHFSVVSAAFDLDGKGPRFMQPFETVSGGTVCPITDLWVNSPGDNTRKKNSDFFIKREEAPMSAAAAALSLFAMQTNAYGGGPGYRTSVRGGGPLTTIVLGQTLWQTLWQNTLLADRMGGLATGADHAVFPWCAATRRSDTKAGGVDTYPKDAHPLQVYWAMPWLIELGQALTRQAPCVLYGETHRARYDHFAKTNYGVNYVGQWLHPLTPYRVQAKSGVNEYISQKGTSRSLRYSNWPALSCTEDEASARIAQSVAHYYSRRRDIRDELDELEDVGEYSPRGDFRLFVFGYEMDNAKTLQWNQGEVPMWNLETHEDRELFAAHAQTFIATTERYEEVLYHGVRKLLVGRVTGKDEKGNVIWDRESLKRMDRSSTAIKALMDELWAGTEALFYATLSDLKSILFDASSSQGRDDALASLHLEWRRALYDRITASFESIAITDVANTQDLRTEVFARRELERSARPTNKSWAKYSTPR